MFDFLKQNDEATPQDVKSLRHRLVQFIKEHLQKWEGGEGKDIKEIQLFISAIGAERSMYEGAVFYGVGEERFKDEVQKIADDYSIELPSEWKMEISFVDELPQEATKAPKLNAAMFIATRKHSVINKASTAYITVLNGEAELPRYTITSGTGKVCIGREAKVQTEEGFMRVNNIAFPTDKHESNKYISRQHAHIEWNNEAGGFFLYADEGGIPPKNKIKVRLADGNLVKLQTTQVGHLLQEGDQVLLGESALLQFSYVDN